MSRIPPQYTILLALLAPIAVALPRTHGSAYRALAREIMRHHIEKELRERSEESIRRSLYRMERNKYVRRTLVKRGKNKYEIRIEVTPQGKEILAGYKMQNLRIKQPPRWDGKWRFVVFDIPEKHRAVRKLFRWRLRHMDFFRVQQSVWVYPYPCKEEIEMLADCLALTNSVFVFEDKLANDKKLREHFTRKGIPFLNKAVSTQVPAGT